MPFQVPFERSSRTLKKATETINGICSQVNNFLDFYRWSWPPPAYVTLQQHNTFRYSI